MFGLAEKLGYFSRTLESGLAVAKMGDKTLRWESGGKTQEQTFNYSSDVDAQQLTDWFEKISESERFLMELERSARFDKAGREPRDPADSGGVREEAVGGGGPVFEVAGPGDQERKLSEYGPGAGIAAGRYFPQSATG